MAELILLASALWVAALVVLLAVRPDLRAWLELPKHRFQDDVRRAERAAARAARTPQERPPA